MTTCKEIIDSIEKRCDRYTLAPENDDPVDLCEDIKELCAIWRKANEND